jgi:hypothetical protein
VTIICLYYKIYKGRDLNGGKGYCSKRDVEIIFVRKILLTICSEAFASKFFQKKKTEKENLTMGAVGVCACLQEEKGEPYAGKWISCRWKVQDSGCDWQRRYEYRLSGNQ